MALWGLVPPGEGCGRAIGLARKAHELDRSLGEAHTSLAWAIFHYDFDFIAAENEFERALELNPRYATAHMWFGMCLAMMGRYEEGYTELKRATRLEPHWSNIRFGQAFVYWSGRRFDLAIDSCKKALELDPNSGQAFGWLGLSHVARSEFVTAVTALERCAALSQRATVPTALLGEGYAAIGDRDRAQAILQELVGRSHVSAYFVARIYAALGHKDEAFQWLETGYQEHGEWMTLLKVDPRFDDLRSEPCLQNLMRRMNFRT